LLNSPKFTYDNFDDEAFDELFSDEGLFVQIPVRELTGHWQPAEIRTLELAAEQRIRPKQVHTRSFSDRPWEPFLHKYASIKQELARVQKAKVARDYAAAQMRREAVNGERSTSSDEVWKTSEDDYLLAARLDRAELVRVAAKRFPRRDPVEVKKRATNLYYSASRAAKKVFPDEDPSPDTIIRALEKNKAQRVRDVTVQVREDMAEFARDRIAEAAEVERAHQREKDDRERADQHRLRLEHSHAAAVRAEQNAAKKAAEARARSVEDGRNLSKWYADLAAWVRCSANGLFRAQADFCVGSARRRS